MNIKSSKELVEKALKEIKTLSPIEIKELNEKNFFMLHKMEKQKN